MFPVRQSMDELRSKFIALNWLRPIVPYLIEMSNLLKREDRNRIKREYCKTMRTMIKPLVDVDPNEDDSVDYLFVLSG